MINNKLREVHRMHFDNGRVDYCEQSFEDMHIFSFEFEGGQR